MGKTKSTKRRARQIEKCMREQLATYLKAERKRSKISQTKLAKALDRSQTTVARVENKRRMLTMSDFILYSEVIGFNPREAWETILDRCEHLDPA